MRDIYTATNDEQRAAVRAAQRTIGVPVTGDLDESTRKRLRGIQALFGLHVTGILDVATMKKIEEIRNQHA